MCYHRPCPHPTPRQPRNYQTKESNCSRLPRSFLSKWSSCRSAAVLTDYRSRLWRHPAPLPPPPMAHSVFKLSSGAKHFFFFPFCFNLCFDDCYSVWKGSSAGCMYLVKGGAWGRSAHLSSIFKWLNQNVDVSLRTFLLYCRDNVKKKRNQPPARPVQTLKPWESLDIQILRSPLWHRHH